MSSIVKVGNARKRLIVDCDPGNGIPGSDVDDGMAIGLALAAGSELELELVTIVAGNTSVEDGYRVARTLLDGVGSSVPVVAGAAQAISEQAEPWIARRKMSRVPKELMNAWDEVPAPREVNMPPGDDAAGAIIDLVSSSPGEITLVAIGPLTNIAHALERRPKLAEELKEVVIMGGAFNVPGFLQELNFGMDPEAAETVMASGAAITLVPLDVTVQTSFTHQDLAVWAESDSALCKYLVETTAPWIDVSAFNKGSDGCYLHDPLAVAYLLDELVGEYESVSVGVETEGRYTRSRPVSWTVGKLRLAAGLALPDRKPINVMTKVDNSRLVKLMESYLVQ